MILILQGLCYTNGQMLANIACASLDDFKSLPTTILIDGNSFTKESFQVQNAVAYYTREPSVTVSSADNTGTFEIIDVVAPGTGPTGIKRTKITI